MKNTSYTWVRFTFLCLALSSIQMSSGMAGPLTTARAGASATKLSNGKVLVAGGIGSSGAPLASSETFDPSTGNFTASGNMANARVNHTATLMSDGRILIAGGTDATSGLPMDSAEIYDPTSGQFAGAGVMTRKRTRHVAVLLNNGKVLLSGGEGDKGAGALSACELFDPSSSAWTATGAMTIGRSEHAAVLLSNGKVFVCGGLGGADGLTAGRKTEQYDPASGAWTAQGDMVDARARHVAVLLGNGKVFISGGTTSELYDAGNGTFTAVAGALPPPEALRGDHGAVRLLTGDVFVYGGALHKRIDGFASRQYRYNTATNNYTPLDPAVADADRTACPVVLLNDGRALVVGGSTVDSTALGTAILYDPTTNTFSIP